VTSTDVGRRAAVDLARGTPAAKPAILGRQMVLLLIAAVGSLSGFYLLLSVVPLYAATAGADGAGVGLSTGAMMLSTVLLELAVPRMVARVGYRAVMALGLILLGAPAAALAASPTLPLVLATSLARGAGLGIVVVAGTALAAEIVPAERRGEGLGVYGVAVGAPAVACLPLGVWLSGHVGYPPVFLAGAALPLAGLLATIGLPARRAEVQRHSAVLGTFRVPGLAGPAVVFAAVTLAAGVLVTFLPLAVHGSSRQFAAVALLAQASLTPVSRWAAGRYGDRHGSSRLLVPAVLAAAVGTASLVWVDSPLAVIAGMGLFGMGFGVAQNATLAVMLERVPQSEFGRVSALWNIAYDGGMGVGAVGVGVLIGWAGYTPAFGLTAAVLAAALGLARKGGQSKGNLS
jgi:MFS family permease